MYVYISLQSGNSMRQLSEKPANQRMWFWWRGQLGIIDAGPANAINIYLKSYELDAKIDAKSLKIH